MFWHRIFKLRLRVGRIEVREEFSSKRYLVKYLQSLDNRFLTGASIDIVVEDNLNHVVCGETAYLRARSLFLGKVNIKHRIPSTKEVVEEKKHHYSVSDDVED